MYYLKNIYKLVAIMILIVFIALPFNRTQATFITVVEDFLALINNYRMENNLSVLSLDSKLQDTAEWMSDDMLANCVGGAVSCSHTDSTGRDFAQRLRDFGYPAGVSASAGENIAWGTGREISAQQAFNMWKASPGHNVNMLKSTYAAIGISRSCNGGSCAWVTDFGSKVVQPYNLISTPIPIPIPTLVFTPTPTPTQSPTPTVSAYVPTLALTSVPTPAIPTPISNSILTSTPALNTNNGSDAIQKSGSNVVDLPEGSLIRENGGIDVYVIKYLNLKKFKRLILSPAVFKNYGHLKWENIITVDRAALDSFTTSALVRAAGDNRVYKLYPSGDTGEKRWVKTETAFLKLGFDWDSVYEVNQFDRDSYFSGNPME